MAKPTNRDCTIRGLVASGFEETFRSGKYRTFLSPKSGTTWMVGKGGALRKTNSTLNLSVSVTGDVAHQQFAYVGRAALAADKAGVVFTQKHLFEARDKFNAERLARRTNDSYVMQPYTAHSTNRVTL